MFETIGKVLSVVGWIIAVLALIGGVLYAIAIFFDGGVWRKIVGVLALGAGIFAFFRALAWTESVPWTLFLSGLAVLMVTCILSGDIFKEDPSERRKREQRQQQAPQKGFVESVLDDYWEKERIKEAVQEAIREEKY